jgi:hypothetical protein
MLKVAPAIMPRAAALEVRALGRLRRYGGLPDFVRDAQ